MFGYENELVFPIYVSNQKFKNSVDLLFLINDDKWNCVYIKDFNTLCFIKQKKKKNVFVKVVYNALVVKIFLIKLKEDCLSINGKQSVKLKKRNN